jgi:hypothetical protein
MDDEARLKRRVRAWLWVFIVGLVLSGVTAFPLVHELSWLVRGAEWMGVPGWAPALFAWVTHVREALDVTAGQYPFLAYGTDWLAFAHLVIAVAFVGPLIDPVRNKWMFVFGLIACASVLPLAVIAGAVRGIPVYWRVIDCCFGVFGCIPLLLCLKDVRKLETMDRRFF